MFDYRNSSTIYISPSTGDDTLCNGLAPERDAHGNGPFRTLDRALFIIDKMRSCGVDRPLTVALCEDYFLDAPLLLSLPSVTLTSFGERRRLVGGVRLGSWEWGSYNGVRCLVSHLPDGVDAAFVTDLFVNGRRADLTRYPKEGTLRVVNTEEFLGEHDQTVGHLLGSSRYFIANKDDLAAIDDIECATVNYYHFWLDEHSPVESYDPESGKLVMRYASRFSVSGNYADAHDPSAMRYFLTNVGSTFGGAGEWYLERATGCVYYIPLEGESPESLEAFVPTLSHLCRITGEDVRLVNLELTCTASEYASTYGFDTALGKYVPGEISYGSDIQAVAWAPGAVRFSGSLRSGMYDCYLHGVGIHGVEVGKGSRHTRIERCLIEDICAGGVKIIGGEHGSDESERTECTVVRDCEIRFVGRRYEAGCGVCIVDASYNEIEGNEIHDMDYSGISVGFVWGYVPNPTYGNIIRRNHIYNIGMGNLSDMGGIYLLGRQRGTVVSENRIHDVTCSTYGAWGLYLDEGASYMTVEKNVVYRTGKECFHLHYGSHNTVKNNILFGVGGSCFVSERDNLHDALLLEGNILVTDGAPIYGPELALSTVAMRRNLLYDTSKASPMLVEHKCGASYDLEGFSHVHHNDCGSIVADPLFVDLEGFDFTLREGSPAFALGFEPLPDAVAKPKSK